MDKEDLIIDISFVQWLLEYWAEECKSNQMWRIDTYDLENDMYKIWEIMEKILNYIKKDEER